MYITNLFYYILLFVLIVLYVCSFLTETHEGPKPSTTKDDWYHGTLSRAEAIQLLTSYSGNSDGRFLVRYSEKEESIVLTMMIATSTTPYNYFIKKQVTCQTIFMIRIKLVLINYLQEINFKESY